MTVDTKPDDWNELAANWQRAVLHPRLDVAALRRQCKAMRRRAVAALAGEALLTLAFAAVAVQLVVRIGDAWSWLIAGDVAAVTGAAWLFAWWNRRGTWQLASESTEAYIALLRLRCRRRMQAAWFVWVVVPLHLIAVTIAGRLMHTSGPGSTLSPWEAIVVPVITVAALVGTAARMYVRARRELSDLDQLDCQAC